MYSVCFPSFNSYRHCAFLGEPDEFFFGRSWLKLWLEGLKSCNSWFCWGFYCLFWDFFVCLFGGLFLPLAIRLKGRCGSCILFSNLSQFCFLMCRGGSFSFVKYHWFERSSSWALGSVWADLVVGEGLWFGENLKVEFIEKFSSQRMWVRVSGTLEEVIFPGV